MRLQEEAEEAVTELDMENFDVELRFFLWNMEQGAPLDKPGTNITTMWITTLQLN